MRGSLQQFKLKKLGAIVSMMFVLVVPAMAQPAQQAQQTQQTTIEALPIEELREFTAVFERIKRSYVDPVDDKKLITQAITGMVAGLDPHSNFMDKEEFREMQVGTRGEFGGLGMEVTMQDGLVKVVSPIDDSPALRAGIKAGDLIAKIGDAFVKGLTLNDAVKEMRGKPDSEVTLSILRKGEAKPLVMTLKRAVIKIQSVKSTLLEPGYAYFRVSQFQQPTGETLAAAIQTAFKKNQGAMKGIVLDLRNDPGGLLDAAVAVSAAFLPKNALVVYTDGRTKDSKMRLTASPENYLDHGATDYIPALPPEIKNVPMVVLVNGGSASASEIVAGALQDYHRAVIMGTPTFGKASVQTVLPLNDGTAVKLTTARYYTPNGRSLQAKGIVPDIALEDAPSSDAALSVHEVDLTGHLTTERNQNKAPAAAATGEIFDFKPAPRPQGVDAKDLIPAPGEVVAKSDYELAQAIAFLKRRETLRASNESAPVKTN